MGENIMSVEPASRARMDARPEKTPFSWSAVESWELARTDFEARASTTMASHGCLMVVRVAGNGDE